MRGTKRSGGVDKGQFAEMQISQKGLQFWEHSLGKEIMAPDREAKRFVQFPQNIVLPR